MTFESESATNFVAGRRRPAASGGTRPNTAPASADSLGTVVASTEADVEAAYAAASDAAQAWAAMGADERRQRLLGWAETVRRRLEDIALVDALDSGTPRRTMRAGVRKGIDYTEYFAGLGLELKGETIPATPQNLHYTVREPYGPVGIVIPFNHPAYFAMSKTAPALMAGNTVVLKPADQTPLSATLIAEASAETLPPGVLNVIQGDAAVGRALVYHPGIGRLHFTGGVRTGLAVQAGAAQSGRVKHVSLELGGKNPMIVFPDANVEEAAVAAVTGMNFTRNQGQSCGSTSRLFVHRVVAREVTERVCELVAKIRLGMPEHDDTEMGSLVSAEHQRRVLGLIQQGVAEGANLLAGGDSGSGTLASGAFVQPTVFDGVEPAMSIAQEEVFGPVLSIIPWESEEEMLRAVNDSEYGLTAAIYTRDIGTALRTAAKVECGYVWINGVETRWKGTPFGGYKNSGLGSEHSIEEMDSYTRKKTVNVLLAE